jgi:hypothetical protein
VSRVHRACILLEIIDDDGGIYAQGIEITGPNAEADVAFDQHFTMDSYSGEVLNQYGFYGVAVRGKGRMFHVDLGGEWPTDPTPEQRSIDG